jgi:hypothetical protein
MLHVINTHGGPKEGGWVEMLLKYANLKVTHMMMIMKNTIEKMKSSPIGRCKKK